VCNRRICSFPSPSGTLQIQFNERGTRLLCVERNQPVAVYDLTKADRNVYLNAPGYNAGHSGSGSFAGKDDELVASGSSENGTIFIWNILENQTVVNEALFTLKHGFDVSGVCYNNTACALATGDNSFGCSEIKFWTPLQLPPSYPLPDSVIKSFICVGEQYDEGISGTDDSRSNQGDEDSEMSGESESEFASSEESQEYEVVDEGMGNNDDVVIVPEKEEETMDFVDEMIPYIQGEENNQDSEADSEEDNRNQSANLEEKEESVVVSSASGRWQIF